MKATLASTPPLLLLLLSAVCFTTGLPTHDNVWPAPQSMAMTEDYHLVHSDSFRIITESSCDIITTAIKRYTTSRLFVEDCSKLNPAFKGKFFIPHRLDHSADPKNRGLLQNVTLKTLTADCPRWPQMDSLVEKYSIVVDEHGATITGQTVWGAIRGLETLSQLLVHTGRGEWALNFVKVDDFPRFGHRGLLIDSARHFLPMDSIIATLDAMEMNKMNVLHWHIVDDQSFPFESKSYPDLAKKGAFEPISHVYTEADVTKVLEEARNRGIRVLSEFDTPGHTLSWGKSQKDILTECYGQDGKPNGVWGPINPTHDSVYPFLQKLFAEIAQRFPDQYLHLGGDEVNFDCWASNPEIKQFMTAHRMGTDYGHLETYYIQKLMDIVAGLNKSYIVWQEVFDNNGTLKEDTVVHVWLPWGANAGDSWKAEMEKVVGRGFHAILSSPWYVDIISYGHDWTRYYEVEPMAFNATEEAKKLVLGGEACLWGEYINGANVIGRAWPRTSAVAERLWSSASVNKAAEAKKRFYATTCRLMLQGLRVEPQDGQEGEYCQCDVAL
ncbi:hypothetical protein TYRP_021422 [Tyrophagus putrescentiae]|nr:hypothetical protein TYRP_021422 [Tyrophagus putrescentiae]